MPPEILNELSLQFFNDGINLSEEKNNGFLKIIQDAMPSKAYHNPISIPYCLYLSHLFSKHIDIFLFYLDNNIIPKSLYVYYSVNIVDIGFKIYDFEMVNTLSKLSYKYKELDFIQHEVKRKLCNLYKRKKYSEMREFLYYLYVMKIFNKKENKKLKNVLTKYPDLKSTLKDLKTLKLIDNINSF
jgi:hypothetical protein